MRYVLDTNAVIALLKNHPASVRKRFREAQADAQIFVPSVVLFELWYGVARSQKREENVERLRVFLSGNVSVMAFEMEDASVAGEIRAQLEAAGRPIGPYDLLIAAQARRNEATLVTANLSEFSRVPDLACQNWCAEP